MKIRDLLRAPPSLVVNWPFVCGSLSSMLDFSRASSGMQVGSNGVLSSLGVNVPRFDYGSGNVVPPTLLYEPQRTNNVRRSNGGATWSTTQATLLVGQALSPDGTVNAFSVTDNATSSIHYASTSGDVYTFVSGTTYTASCCLKAGTETCVQITFSSTSHGTAQYANFDIQNGVVGAYADCVPFIRALGNGFFRCGITAAANNAVTTSTINLIATNGDPNSVRAKVYAGMGKTFYAYGAQMEVGAAASSIILTSGEVVTRAGDQLSFTIPNGINALRYVFDNGSTQDVVVSAGAYTVPTTLDRMRIARIHSL